MDVSGVVEGIREGGCIPPAEYEKEKVGEYTLLSELGRGEKAVVYLAVDSHGREVAIKAFLTETELNFKEYSKYYFTSSWHDNCFSILVETNCFEES